MSKNRGAPVGVQQCELLAKPFAVVDGSASVVALVFPMIDVLNRTPAGYVALLPISKNTVQEARRAKKSYVTSVQRSDRPAFHLSSLV